MISRRITLALVATVALISTAFQPCVAQTSQSLNPQSAVPLAASASTAVPALVPFSGVITEPDGKPVSGETAITFLIFKDQEGSEPLFAETQAVTPDASGHYKVELGATLGNGLPADLFSTGEARWLEVQAAGQPPQPRVLMASVPYALKAADSATLGGLPASAFVLAGSKAAADVAATVSAATTTGSNVTTTGGVSGYIPEFSGASTLVDSPVFVNGANVGIGTATPTATLDVNGTALISGTLNVNSTSTLNGPLVFASTGTATASKDYPSQYIKLQTSAYNSATASTVQPRFQLQAEAKSNNTATPTATLNLISSTSNAAPAETGFYFNANGTINFAKGQTFPGTGTGNGTITGVTAGTGLTGGGTAGNVSLNVNQGVVAFQSDLTSAEKTLNASITAAQTNAVSSSEAYSNSNFLPLGGGGINGNVSIQGSAQQSPNVLSVTGSSFQALGLPGQGIALTSGTGGTGVLATAGNGGSIALTAGTGGYSYAGTGGNGGQIVLRTGQVGGGDFGSGARGQVLVEGDDDGLLRAAPAQLQIQGISNPNKQLLIGYLADGLSDYGYGTIQATYEGVANTRLLLNPNGGGVGIQTTAVTNILTLGQGQGAAIGDGWSTYSSRRFKTDIQTLPNALGKVEKLRGVSYTLKATGKREIGVIAEEVGAVVPEVVTYEKNGVDARSVDYTRLTALLIEATKEQQMLIQQQQKQIKVQQAQIRAQQRVARLQQTQIVRLASQMRTVQATLKDSDRPGSQARTVAQLTMSH